MPDIQFEQKLAELERKVMALEQQKGLMFPIDPMTKKIILDATGNIDHFVDLGDAPATITANKYLRGDSSGSALVFDTPDFTDLSNAPALQTNQFLRANSAGVSLEFANPLFTDLNDTPASLTANHFYRANSAGTSLVAAMPHFSQLPDGAALIASQFLRANAGGTSLEFTSIAAGIQNVSIGTVNAPPIGGTGDEFAISVGFVPSILIFLGSRSAAGNTAQGHHTSYGFATGTGATQQYHLSQSYNSTNEAAATSGGSQIWMDLDEGTYNSHLAITAWDTAITFYLTVNPVKSYAATDFLWLAFN